MRVGADKFRHGQRRQHGDGYCDLIWQESSNGAPVATYLWLMKGTTTLSSILLGGAGYHVTAGLSTSR